MFVNSEKGSDKNDGLTSSAPLKTIKKAMDKIIKRKENMIYVLDTHKKTYPLLYK